MKTSKQTLILLGGAALTLATLSWEKSDKIKNSSSDDSYSRIFSGNYEFPMAANSDFEAYAADLGADFYGAGYKKHPPAEDVLVQKIPGDNYHMLLMAVYSFENYSDPSITIERNGENIELRDDGRGYDKVAGDGVYTTKVFADVNEFRKQAIAMQAVMKKNGTNIQFFNREIANPQNCLRGSFDLDLLDKNQPVSIAGLTSDSNSLIDSVRRNCIFITDLGVVEDPTRTWNPCTQTGNVDGPWTFKTIMKNLAKSTARQDDPSDSALSAFVMRFLSSWTNEQVINGDTVPVRPMIIDKVINPWLAKSEAAGAPPGQLDMRFAPYKLTSIVNRFDLRERASGIPAGEGRYTFCMIDSSCTDALQATMVVEFGIQSKNACDSLQQWALRWYNLKDLTLGSPEYNAALQDITDRFSLWGTASRDAKIALDAIRTNEIAFAPEDGSIKRYEFREFKLLIDSVRRLSQVILEQIPRDKFNAQVENPDVTAMVTWINNNKKDIKNDAYTVPDSIGGQPFLGGHAQILGDPVGFPTGPYHWNGVETRRSPARIKNTTTRHVFSRNTCTGCHAGEIQTFFTHVDPVFFGTQATLSGFLTGTAGRGGAIDFDGNPDNDSMMVADAAARGGVGNTVRMFNDILRRAKDLKDFATTPPCAGTTLFALRDQLMFSPMGAVH